MNKMYRGLLSWFILVIIMILLLLIVVYFVKEFIFGIHRKKKDTVQHRYYVWVDVKKFLSEEYKEKIDKEICRQRKDLDGDIVVIDGNKFFVHVFGDIYNLQVECNLNDIKENGK